MRQLAERRQVAGVLIIIFVFLNFLMSSWRTWGDPVVDFPNQLYMAWRIASGEILYRDILHYYGPLSQLVNGTWFKIFGTSYINLVSLNLIIALSIALVTYFLFLRVFDWLTGLVAALAFVLIHAFQNLGITSAFNFVAPYSHEATHGVLLIILLTAVSVRTRVTSRRSLFVVQGVLLGLCFLTKPEFVASSTLIVVTNVVLDTRELSKYRFRSAMRLSGFILLGALLPLALCTLYFALVGKESPSFALRSTFGALYPLFTTDLTANPIYQRVLGTLGLGQNLHIIFEVLTILVIILGVALGIDMIRDMRIRLTCSLLYLTLLAIVLNLISMLDIARIWPPLSTLGFAGIAYLTFRKKLSRETSKLALFLAFPALILGAKEYFHASFSWLGFYLSLPATFFIVGLAISIVPGLIQKERPGTFAFQWASLIVIASTAIQAAQQSSRGYALRDLAIGDGSDRFFVLSRPYTHVTGAMVKEILTRVQERVAPGSTLLALPEGQIVNYLLRLHNSTPFSGNFVAKTLYDAWGGGQAIVARLQATPPDYVLYLKRMPEIPGAFYQMRGTEGFANVALDWIDAHYQEIDRIGRQTHNFAELGYILLKRKKTVNEQSPVTQIAQ